MEHRLRTGHLAALGGAIAMAAALWLPWYEIKLGDLARGVLRSQSDQLRGGFGEFARGLAAILPESISGTGWEVLRGADAALLVGAVLVAALVLAAGGAFGAAVRVDPATAGRLIAALGVAESIIVAQHILSPPGPDGLVSAKAGLWVALAGAVVTALAGFTLTSAPNAAEPVLAPAPYSFTAPISDTGPLEPARPSVAPPPGS